MKKRNILLAGTGVVLVIIVIIVAGMMYTARFASTVARCRRYSLEAYISLKGFVIALATRAAAVSMLAALGSLLVSAFSAASA